MQLCVQLQLQLDHLQIAPAAVVEGCCGQLSLLLEARTCAPSWDLCAAAGHAWSRARGQKPTPSTGPPVGAGSSHPRQQMQFMRVFGHKNMGSPPGTPSHDGKKGDSALNESE